jgi:hypothetical protein
MAFSSPSSSLAMSNPDHAIHPSQEARERFGRTITAWVERAGWSHDIPLRWGKAAGFLAVADSTFNKMQRGKIAQPYPVTFIQFGMMNDRLARKDYGLTEGDPLLARIARQRAIEHDDGRAWTATDFFSHFIGELDPPAWAKEQPLPTLEEAVAASAKAVALFKKAADAAQLPLPEAWASLADHAGDAQCPVLPALGPEELESLRMVLSGWHTWTPQQLRDLLDLDGNLRPLRLLDYWMQATSPTD